MSALSKFTDDPDNYTPPPHAVLYVGKGNRLAVKPTLQALKPYRTYDIYIIQLPPPTEGKSFQNMIAEWQTRIKLYDPTAKFEEV